MLVFTVDGAYVAYDGTSDVEVVFTANGVDVAWQEAEVAEEYIPQVIMVM